jgi:hypothetical protein
MNYEDLPITLLLLECGSFSLVAAHAGKGLRGIPATPSEGEFCWASDSKESSIFLHGSKLMSLWDI